VKQLCCQGKHGCSVGVDADNFIKSTTPTLKNNMATRKPSTPKTSAELKQQLEP
jgi:hypothetical protein